MRSYTSCMSNIEVPAVSSTTITYTVVQNGGDRVNILPPWRTRSRERTARRQSYGGAAAQIFLTKTGLWSCDRGPLSLTFRLTSVRVYGEEQRTAHSYYPGERAPSNMRDVPNPMRTMEDHDFILNVALIKLRICLWTMQNNYDYTANIN